jgi:hypothetical protein
MPRELSGAPRDRLGNSREFPGIIGSLGNDLGTPRECLGNSREFSGIIGSPENDVIPRSFQDHFREIINKEMVLGLKNGILLDGIAIIILTFFLPTH